MPSSIDYISEKVDGNWSKIRWIILFLACSSLFFYLSDHTRITYDEMLQVGAVHSFLQGESLTLQRSLPDQLGEFTRIPLLNIFPPGYSLIMASLYPLLGNMGAANLFLSIAAACIFFLSWFFIFEMLGHCFPVKGRLLLFLYWGCIFSPIMVPLWTGHTSGMVSIAFFSLNLSCCTYALKVCRSGRVYGMLFAGGIFMGCAMAMRYAYLPIAVVMPIAILIHGLFWNRGLRSSFSGAFMNGAGALCSSSLFYAYNYFLFGKPIGFRNASSVLYWENLKWIIPFPAHSFGLMDARYFRSRGVIHEISMPETVSLPGVMEFLSFAVLFIFIVTLFRTLKRVRKAVEKREKGEKIKDVKALSLVLVSGCIAFLVIITFLAYMSLHKELLKWTGGWTFLSELRYYTPIFCFFGLVVCMAMFRKNGEEKKVLSKILYTGALLFFLASAFYVVPWRLQMYARQISRPESFRYGIGNYLGKDESLVSAVKEVKENYSDGVKPVIVMTNKKNLIIRGIAMALGVAESPALFDDPEFRIKPVAETDILLVSYIKASLLERQRVNKIARHFHGRIIGRNGDYVVYYFSVGPDNVNLTMDL